MPRHMHSLWQQGDACVAPTEPLCAAPACQLWNVHACEGTRPSSTLGLFPPPFIACGSDDRAARRAATSLPVIPAERAGLRPARESRNPVIKAVRAFTPAVDYWVPARARPVERARFGGTTASRVTSANNNAVAALPNPSPTAHSSAERPHAQSSVLGSILSWPDAEHRHPARVSQRHVRARSEDSGCRQSCLWHSSAGTR